ncbi:ATP binding / protein kinase/ protein serine/threonine kinase/ protein-tyrosine kinase [Ectocarpus siliculosus]|uniref:ATP binding / protein kinase/ protein serine/threonine kinase/ protein-tyrosine kinase n=1 Tax=Ectocarpus siliculosus TaxID=2880 RepID=D8LRH1_ECTSI|nr:ATP binding / protein kinase/ protein serine/threonine kinase/ protein-tyrosine kinase [Ectocarpus siliculosus]|eukprot:CBN75072.1 ATP binding / protein kinase/ protein serine/threonine kinase/ protein-tyrosine kinase [Ectocarpus siliculosus]
MIRNNDTMRKAAQKEVALLKELAEHDPLNKKHCIRLLCSLEHKQHVVMVFESMQMNLRETLKKFGRKTGINIHAVQKYGKQLLAALKHMASRNLVHADIKPDNILVDQGFGSLKLADFGSAFRITDPDNDPTPYLVSRWYRAPEIVMGLEYDKAIDLWSVAVTLFELYKGSPVLPGVNNNEMLKRMMEFKGPVPTRMVKSHMRAFETMGGIRPHFTEGGQFMQQEPDPVSGQTTVRLVTVTAPSRPIKSDIMRSKGAQDKKETVADLADFLDKCMALDPKQRISLGQCSAHSFLRRA